MSNFQVIPMWALFFPFLFIFIFGFCFNRLILKLSLEVSFFITLFKALVPLLYFSQIFDGSWMLDDDIEYFKDGAHFVKEGFNPLNILSATGINSLHGRSASHHILYPYHNVCAIWLFGAWYSSPIFLNVLLTYIGGYWIKRIALSLDFSEGYSIGLAGFYLIFWDTISWSSFVNLKEVWVQTLTLSILCGFIHIAKFRQFITALVIVSLSLLLMYYCRYYLVVLLPLSFVIWLVAFRSLPIALPLIACGMGLVYWLFGSNVMESFLSRSEFFQFYYGFVRFPLTPIPWNVDAPYAFLTPGAFLHWVFFPFAFTGLIDLWNSKLFKLLAIYALVIILFYSVVGSMQTVRHRAQISWIFAWGIFHFIWMIKYARVGIRIKMNNEGAQFQKLS